MDKFKIDRGSSLPFGPTRKANGYNFSLFSKHATNVTLCLFDPQNKEMQDIPLHPKINKTGDIWHVFVHGLPAQYRYAYSLEGPYDPLKGFFYDSSQIILDPYAHAVDTDSQWGKEHYKSHMLLGIVDPVTKDFDWENDMHPNFPTRELIIYEMHVGVLLKLRRAKSKIGGLF
jgi:isoamylase